MLLKTVLKVDISCLKCKKKLLKAVSGLQGVDKVEADEAKGTLTVTGDADPYEVIIRTRKVGRYAEVVSVGPPPKPDQKRPSEDKKPDDKKQQQQSATASASTAEKKTKPPQQQQEVVVDHQPHSCPVCQHLEIIHLRGYESYYEPYGPSSCFIM